MNTLNFMPALPLPDEIMDEIDEEPGSVTVTFDLLTAANDDDYDNLYPDLT